MNRTYALGVFVAAVLLFPAVSCCMKQSAATSSQVSSRPACPGTADRPGREDREGGAVVRKAMIVFCNT